MADDGEEEEDYMSDLSRFLPPDNTSKTSSNKLCSKRSAISQPTSKKPKTLNWQEQRKQTREQKQEEEDKKIIASLDSAIPQSNIGFKLLKQMGYTPGSALGKEGFGRIDPVGIEIRRSRAGIGREDPRKEKMRMEEEKMVRERNIEKELMVDFGSRKKEQWKNRKVVVDYHKAKAAFDQLENKEVQAEQEKKSDDEEEEKEKEEEEEEIITEEDLEEMLMKLREEYQYCLYCGCRFESKDALLSGCPGINEDDH